MHIFRLHLRSSDQLLLAIAPFSSDLAGGWRPAARLGAAGGLGQLKASSSLPTSASGEEQLER
jgi:hypothetical protein